MSGLSNHSQQTNDGCAQRIQRRILNTDGNVMAKPSYALRILFLYRVLYVFNVLTPTCAAVSAPL